MELRLCFFKYSCLGRLEGHKLKINFRMGLALLLFFRDLIRVFVVRSEQDR